MISISLSGNYQPAIGIGRGPLSSSPFPVSSLIRTVKCVTRSRFEIEICELLPCWLQEDGSNELGLVLLSLTYYFLLLTRHFNYYEPWNLSQNP